MIENDTIRLGNEIWEVVFEDKPVSGVSLCDGICLYTERKIVLSNKITGTRLMETFLHECIHALDFMYDIQLSEHQVHLLAVTLIPFIRDNKINFLA